MVDVDADEVGGAGDMSPEDAAAYATEGPEGQTLESGGGGFGSGGGPLSRLFDGDATGPQVSELQGDYSVGRDVAVMLRGALRTATGSGVPPVFEIVMGGLLFMRSQNDGEESDGELEGERAEGVQGGGL